MLEKAPDDFQSGWIEALESQDQLIEGKDYNYLNKDGVDPLSDELREVPFACAKCNGEGCEWCDKK